MAQKALLSKLTVKNRWGTWLATMTNGILTIRSFYSRKAAAKVAETMGPDWMVAGYDCGTIYVKKFG
jgi:hypothetical protein